MLNNFKFFCNNDHELIPLQRSLRDLVDKWEATGLLDDAVCPELVATVMETTVSYYVDSLNDYKMEILLPTLSRLFRNKERYYSDERILALSEELVSVIELNEFNDNDWHTRLDWVANTVNELCEFFDWEE